MSDKQRDNFHNLALKSALFKGRPDLYFCYLKSEKIAHVIAVLLVEGSGMSHPVSDSLMRTSVSIPASIARFAAGEFEDGTVLADLFEVLSLLRLSVSHGLMEERNARILIQEYEVVAEKIALGNNVSPFLSLEDLAVPSLNTGDHPTLPPSPFMSAPHLKDTKGLAAGSDKSQKSETHIGQNNERGIAILKLITERRRVSIKDISKVIRGCSEKTIQRELGVLIQQGLVRKEGERRWSVYMLAEKKEA